jgi:hypothetical protein
VHGRVQLERVDVVPQRDYLRAQFRPRLAVVVAEEERGVLEHERARVVVRKQFEQHLPDLVPRIVRTLHIAPCLLKG